jgi:tRNA(His) 5'-end guanylyltransferase
MPIILRVDGRSFSNYTKNLKLKKPFDERLKNIFIEVSKDLINEFNPRFVYTFSDEMNILFDELPFNGRIEKINSVISSYITSSFMKHLFLNKDLFDVNVFQLKPVSFDCRIIVTPNHLKDYFKWRQDEAWRNCLNSYAQSVLNENHSNKETSQILFKLKKSDIHQLLYEQGINIAHVPTWHKRGLCLYRTNDKKLEEYHIINHKNILNTSEIYIDLEMDLL